MEWNFGRTRAVQRRGYLPHVDIEGATQFISFRLFDSLPGVVVEGFKRELRDFPPKERQHRLGRRIERFLDRGWGCCFLRCHDTAQAVETVLLRADGDRYRLHAWVVMPNHVHVLATLLKGFPLSCVVGAWKRFSALGVNRQLAREGPVWERGYFDRWIRDESHFKRVVSYIHNNPVKGGLCSHTEEFRWSSASRRRSFSDCL